MDARDLMDKGLRSVAQNEFEDGLSFFQNALKVEPNNVTVGWQDGLKYFSLLIEVLPFSDP